MKDGEPKNLTESRTKRPATRRRRGKKLLRPKRLQPRTADEFFTLPDNEQDEWEKFLRVLAKMRSAGLSLTKAAKQEDVNPRMISRLAGRALKRRSNGSYAVTKTDSLLRVLQVPTAEGAREIAVRNSRTASTLGQYWDAVDRYIRTGDDSRLKKFSGKPITDSTGNKFTLITDRRELNRLGSAGVLTFESLYARSA